MVIDNNTKMPLVLCNVAGSAGSAPRRIAVSAHGFRLSKDSSGTWNLDAARNEALVKHLESKFTAAAIPVNHASAHVKMDVIKGRAECLYRRAWNLAATTALTLRPHMGSGAGGFLLVPSKRDENFDFGFWAMINTRIDGFDPDEDGAGGDDGGGAAAAASSSSAAAASSSSAAAAPAEESEEEDGARVKKRMRFADGDEAEEEEAPPPVAFVVPPSFGGFSLAPGVFRPSVVRPLSDPDDGRSSLLSRMVGHPSFAQAPSFGLPPFSLSGGAGSMFDLFPRLATASVHAPALAGRGRIDALFCDEDGDTGPRGGPVVEEEKALPPFSNFDTMAAAHDRVVGGLRGLMGLSSEDFLDGADLSATPAAAGGGSVVGTAASAAAAASGASAAAAAAAAAAAPTFVSETAPLDDLWAHMHTSTLDDLPFDDLDRLLLFDLPQHVQQREPAGVRNGTRCSLCWRHAHHKCVMCMEASWPRAICSGCKTRIGLEDACCVACVPPSKFKERDACVATRLSLEDALE